jgi:16S rRNA (guanine527-N7)-methyltransferase
MFHVKQPLGPDGLSDIMAIEDDALRRLETYLDVLGRWQERINLVGRETLADPWRRHILDSAQLLPLLPKPPGLIADLGSGAGFPGLVVAILTGAPVFLIESDGRKCAFLAEAARITGTDIQIRCERAESLAPLGATVITARACAPLPRLLDLASRHLAPGGLCLFLKGRTAPEELTVACETWTLNVSRVPSLSDPSGVILQIRNRTRRDDRPREPSARDPYGPARAARHRHRQSEGRGRKDDDSDQSGDCPRRR